MMKFIEAERSNLQVSGEIHSSPFACWENFIRFLQQVIQAGQTAQLSDRPLTQGMIQQIQQQTE
jgi:hypothetical protein